MAMAPEPRLQRQQPLEPGHAIGCGGLKAGDGVLQRLLMGSPMARAEAAMAAQPALLQPHMQAQAPEQTAAGALHGQGLRSTPAGVIGPMPVQQLSQHRLEPIVLALEQSLLIRQRQRPATAGTAISTPIGKPQTRTPSSI